MKSYTLSIAYTNRFSSSRDAIAFFAANAGGWDNSLRQQISLHLTHIQGPPLDRNGSRETYYADLCAGLYVEVESFFERHPERRPAVSDESLERFKELIVLEKFGLGALEYFIALEDWQQIRVIGENEITLIDDERQELKTGLRFSSQRNLEAVIERLLAPLGDRVDGEIPVCKRLWHDRIVCVAVSPATPVPFLSLINARKLSDQWPHWVLPK